MLGVEAVGLDAAGFWLGATLACFFEGWEGADTGASFRVSALRFLLDCAAKSGSSGAGSSI